MDQSNSTAVIRAAINIFLCIAIGVSLFQELNFTSTAESPEQPVEPVAEINQNGQKVDYANRFPLYLDPVPVPTRYSLCRAAAFQELALLQPKNRHRGRRPLG